MPNSSFNKSPRQVSPPIRVGGIFPMRLGAQMKGSIYGFGNLGSMVGKITSTSPSIRLVSGKPPSFGKLSNVGTIGLSRRFVIGVGSPVSISRFK